MNFSQLCIYTVLQAFTAISYILFNIISIIGKICPQKKPQNCICDFFYLLL